MIVLQIFVSVFGFFVRPERLSCPDGWIAQGVRRSGETTCLLFPEEPDCPPGPVLCTTSEAIASISIKVYCDEDRHQRPICIDWQTIECVYNKWGD